MPLLCSRRALVKASGLAALASVAPSIGLGAKPSDMLSKQIPVSGESLPVIGMGTWRTFNIGSDTKAMNHRAEIVQRFFELGGRLIDSSPMYGSAPDVMGYALQRVSHMDQLFSAEKIWSPAGGDTKEQFDELARRWQVESFDLVQIHNLRDWREHLPVLQEMKADGKIRYIGITTSHGRRHADFEQILDSEAIDFAQLTYNIRYREVDERLLPAAMDRGVAVIANRPYDGGGLIKRLKTSAPIPEFAKDAFDCSSWADYLLKFIVSHPGVHCAIPATSKIRHLEENMLAGSGTLPDAATRKRMIDHVRTL